MIFLTVCGSGFVSQMKAIASLVPKIQHVSSALKQGDIVQKVRNQVIAFQKTIRNEFRFLECSWNHEYFGSLAKNLLCKRPEVFMIP